jgi:site-specific DNA-cytosine methylase
VQDIVEIRHFHLFCGIGGGARGFNAGHARLGRAQAAFRCIGGVDADSRAVADFSRLAGVDGTTLDLFDREQYRDFYGEEPPAEWREATPEDLRRAAGGEAPDIVFTSPPCKGFSGLLPEHRSTSARYQALNRLTVRSVMLALEAWADDPPSFFILENVPRIATRGRRFLEQIEALLTAAGYSITESTHDCGELGGLGQHRKRFLLVARHRERVRSVGEVLGEIALPDDPASGPMHRLPRLSWETWVRLALIPAGGDWRALRGLDLSRLGIVPVGEWHRGTLGVTRFEDAASTVTGAAAPGRGAFSVSEPRWGSYGQLGVMPWSEASHAVTGQAAPGAGPFSVADPRPKGWGGGRFGVVEWKEPVGAVTGEGYPSNGAFVVADPRAVRMGQHHGKLRVEDWAAPSHTVTGSDRVGSGALSVADPRGPRFNNVFRIARWDDPSPAVTGGSGPSSGGIAVADPRRAGNYGVVAWSRPAGAVTGNSRVDAGNFSVADPRLPAPGDHPDPPPLLISLDQTWHRPFTTLELGALQGFPVEYLGAPLVLDGKSHSRWREAIGNAVPPPTASAIASVMGRALLAAGAGETFTLEATPIWARRLAVLVAMDG